MKLSANALKWIAIFAMFSDHLARSIYNVGALSIAGTLPPIAFIMLTIGKITAPIMFFFVAEGFSKTRNVKKYAIRLGIFALISHIPYNLFINNVVERKAPTSGNLFELASQSLTLAPTSVIFTLFLAVIALITYESKLESSIKIFAIFMIIAISSIGDWGIVGVIIPLILHMFKEQPKIKWALFFVSMIGFAFMLYFPLAEWMMILTIVIGAIGSFVILQTYNGTKGIGGKINKWAFYIIYPLHLLIIWVLFVNGFFNFLF